MVNGRKIEAKMVKGSVFDGVVGESTLGIAQVKSNCYSVNYGLGELEFSMLTVERVTRCLVASGKLYNP
jgi:hypothetical protein